MSKYIIELGEEANMVQAINVTQNGNVYVNAKYVTELKELTSDYINEHYGQLQDDAYQKGFEDGKAVNDKGCEGCKYGGLPQGSSPCYNCSNYYKNNWTAKVDKIEVGDEVVYEGHRFVVFTTETEEHYASLFDVNGNHASVSQSKCKKTGRHFDIAKILEDMRND